MEAFSKYMSTLGSQDEKLKLALECFEIFVGANFCGILEKVQKQASNFLFLQSKEFVDYSIEQLSFGSNKPFSAIRCVEFLWVAKQIFSDDGCLLKSATFEQELWRLRIHQIWATVLEEKSPQLKEIIDSILEKLELLLKNKTVKISSKLVIQYYLERATFELEYFERNKAKSNLEKAAEAAGIKLELDGALGKRTFFQCKSVAQLGLSMTTVNGNSSSSTQQEAFSSDLPLNCKNTDDTLLDTVKFDEKHMDGASIILSDEQLACILAIGIFESKAIHSAGDEVDAEVPFVYVNKVIEQRRNWSIQTRALLERSSLEKWNSRKVERACSQMETIVKLLDGVDDKPNNCKLHRLYMLFSSSPVPFWKAKLLQAEILASLGCISEALLIYESLNMWESVVSCYKMLKQQEKAENLVRDLLKQNECSKYYCILGDITLNPEYYLKAIQISNDTSAQASASIGRLLMLQKQYIKAINYFKRSVELQPFQLGVWFNLGYCAMKENNYSEAIRAFHKCVSFEPEHFEAWNNLAACYVKINQKERAHKVLMECLKLNYENWNVWENFMIISVDIGDIPQALAAISKLLDLDTKKSIDQLTLEIISEIVLKADGTDMIQLRKHLMEILSRVASRQSLNSKVMRLYAELKKPPAESTDLCAWSTYTQLLEKSVQRSSKELATKTVEENAESLENTLELVSALQSFWKITNLESSQVLSRTRLRIRPILSFMDKQYGSACCNANNERLKNAYSKACVMIESI